MRRRNRFERLEARTLLAAGLIPVDTTFSVDTNEGGLQISGNAVLRFDAVVLDPALDGPEDISLTNVEVTSSGQVSGLVDGFNVVASFQTTNSTPPLAIVAGVSPDTLQVDSVGPDHFPGTVTGTVAGQPIQNGLFTATLVSGIDFPTSGLSGTLGISITGTVFGVPFSESAQAAISQTDVIPSGTEFPDPSLRSVSGRVFSDADGDGLREAGDQPVENITAVLLQDSVAIDSMQVDSNGFYSFYNLPSGNYQVRFDNVPSGQEFTLLQVGADTTVDSDVDPATGATATLDFSGGQTLLNVDAGIRTETTNEFKLDTIGLYQGDISLFHLKESFTPGPSDQYFGFGPGGNAGWTPVVGDWNGDGIDTIGLYQPDISLFHLKDSFTPGASDQYFAFGPGGNAGWIPLAGDWNGDGTDTIGLYQPDISLFHLKDSFTPGASDHYFAFGPGGNAGWIPLAGDWNGDGVDTIGLYQPDISLFHLKDSFTPGASDQYFAFGPGGNAGWTPLAGDWNGDATDTIGLYQPDISLFHLKDTFTPGASDQYFAFGPGGNAGWTPLAGDWNGPESPVLLAASPTLASPSDVLRTGAKSVAEPEYAPAPLSLLTSSNAETKGIRWSAEAVRSSDTGSTTTSSDSSGQDGEETSSDASPLQLLDDAFAAWR
nr:SdrD B-like domain-containing protein [Rhodopirellula sp. SM50]